MTIGPVQLMVLGFRHPNFQGEILAELDRLRKSDMVRVVDSLIIHKDVDGELEIESISNLTDDEAAEYGTIVRALVGLGIDGDQAMTAGPDMMTIGEATMSSGDPFVTELSASGVHTLPDEDVWDVVGEIPNDSAAAIVLLEHHWAAPLRDAVIRANGFRVGDAFVSPLDLAEIGLLASTEARRIHQYETSVINV